MCPITAVFACSDVSSGMHLIKHVRHFRPHQNQRGHVIASGRWTGEEAYRKVNKSPVQLVEGTDFLKLPREEALNQKVQRQRVHIPTFGPVPLVESTHTLTQSTEPTQYSYSDSTYRTNN